MAGGKIWYEYAGDAQHPYRYNVYMILERDISGVTMTSYLPATICITSSCFSTTTLSMPLLPFSIKPGSDTIPGSYSGSIVTPGQSDCLGQMSSVAAESYFLHQQVDLPGKCADFSFNYSVSARNASSNLTTSGNFYIEAKLNNLHGPNSSPRFINPAFKSFCVGTSFEWSQEALEPNGDSIYYDFGTPQTGNCGNPVAMTFRSGYSQSNPMTTVNGINLDSNSGLLSFTPAQTEVVVIHIVATEYRFDSILQLHLIVGSSEMDIQIPIVANCRAEIGTWLTDRTDSVKNIAPILCGDSIVNIKTKRKFLNTSLAADGSDFALLNSKGTLLPIIGAGIGAKGNSSNEAASFWLKLNDTIGHNDTLTLITRVGNDLNTLVNTCGGELNAGDSVIVVVNSCNSWITKVEYSTPQLKLYPNPVRSRLDINIGNNIINGHIQVINLNGGIVLEKTISGQTQYQINLGFLPVGIYLLKVTSNNWSQVSKFQKI